MATQPVLSWRDDVRAVATAVLIPALYFGLGFGLHLLGGAIDQPHPVYLEGNWFTHRVGGSFQYGLLIGAAMLIFVAVDLTLQRFRSPGGGLDVAYYPRPSVFVSWRHPVSRMALVIGLVLVAYYVADVGLEVCLWRSVPGGWVWPPERVLIAGLFTWGVVWLADCLTRPAGGTAAAAVCFLVFVWLIVLPTGSQMIRE
jgi:hypothetical protein